MSSEKETNYAADAASKAAAEGDEKSLRGEQLENGVVGEELSPEHRAYLLERHGRVDLKPLPSSSPDDPLNWPVWKVSTKVPYIHQFTYNRLLVIHCPAYCFLLFWADTSSEKYKFGARGFSCYDDYLYWCWVSGFFYPCD